MSYLPSYFLGVGMLWILLFLSPIAVAQSDSTALPNGFHHYGIYDTDLLSAAFHRNKRQALRDSLPDNAVAVFFSHPIRNRSNDVDYAFHQNPNFYYLTGLKESNAILLIFKNRMELEGKIGREVLFLQSNDPAEELWNGRRFGVQGAEEVLGVDMAFENKKFADAPLNWDQFDHIYALLPKEEIRDNKRDRGDVYSLVRHFLKKTDTLESRSNYNELNYWMANLREKKEKEELVLLQKAVDATVAAQLELMRSLSPEMTEYQAEAIIEYTFKAVGAEQPGFPSIVGSGENSCILHYTSNRRKMGPEDLLVVDVGAEYHGYTADITRTLPVNGTFSEEQRAVYEIVLEAQRQGIKASVPGNKFWAPNDAAVEVISKGLQKLGITQKRHEFKKYFMHGTSHYLGLDVHDVGLYGPLAPGNVITVEPGIYIPEGSDCDPKWWNIGIRIEDDVLITTAGPEVLSSGVPVEINEIEQLMREKGKFELGSN